MLTTTGHNWEKDITSTMKACYRQIYHNLNVLLMNFPNMEIKLLECFRKYKAQNLRMRRYYKYAVENDHKTLFSSQLIEYWYFWTMDEVQKHIELEEHLSSCYLITHESSVDSVMENLDMKSVELKKFDQLPKELIRSCVQRRIVRKKRLDIKRTMKAYVEKTADLYNSEPMPTEKMLSYMCRRDLFTGLELNPETYSSLTFVEKLVQFSTSYIIEDIYMIIMEYRWKRINKETMLQKIEDFCEDYIKNTEPYVGEVWTSGHLYYRVYKEMKWQKQKMENSLEDSEGKETHGDAEWIHKEIQMFIERNASDIDEEKHRKSFFDDAKSRWQSVLQEGRTLISNKATKSSHFAKPCFHEIVGWPEDFIHRLFKAISEIKSVINIFNGKINWLSFMAGNLKYCEGKVFRISKEISVLGVDEKYTQLYQPLIL